MAMQPHTIAPAYGAKKTVKRLGRGAASGRGTTAGRGTKGQKARTGGRGGLKIMGFKDLLQSTPKLRGFRSLAEKPTLLKLSALERYFENGQEVTLAALQEKKLVKKNVASAKVVGGGTLGKKLTLVGIATTESVRAAIAKAGGTVTTTSKKK